MNKNITKFTILVIFIAMQYPAIGQKVLKEKTYEKEFVEDVFTSTQLINSQTSKIQYPKSWYFEIQHRFGQVGLDSSFYQQLLGLDLSSNIRFAFGRSFTERMYMEVGRTNHLKTIDFECKYLIAKQTADFKMPVSLAIYFNTAVRSDKFPNVPPNAYFKDTITPFYYKATHRLGYNSQVIISSKLTNKLSLQVTPILVYQNLASPGYDNYTFTLSGGGRYKYGLNSSIIFEYAHLFNNRINNFYNPLSVGVEFGTAGHVFQLFLSSSTKIIESHIYTTNPVNYKKGEFLIGFNMQRNFWNKK